jgi:steroid 5-alpha reductase family enzyme
MRGPLRIIFPSTVLLIWALFGIALAQGAWTTTQWLIVALAHALCAVVFVQFIYIFNYGYALCMAVISVALLALAPSAAAALVALAATAFGLRLLAFTRGRYAAASYAASRARQRESSDAMPLVAKTGLWILVSWLMAFEAMPVYFVARAGRLDGWVAAGVLLMLAGLVLEAVADRQKQAAKARDPAAFVSEGLFRRARHPNYLGEMLVQLGLIVAVAGSVHGLLETAMGMIAPAYIIVLMYWSGRAADQAQAERHGQDPAYVSWREGSGCFLPGW